jgi:hypothetical protein
MTSKWVQAQGYTLISKNNKDEVKNNKKTVTVARTVHFYFR